MELIAILEFYGDNFSLLSFLVLFKAKNRNAKSEFVSVEMNWRLLPMNDDDYDDDDDDYLQ